MALSSAVRLVVLLPFIRKEQVSVPVCSLAAMIVVLTGPYNYYLIKKNWILITNYINYINIYNYLKITGILNNVFRPQKTLKKTRIKLYNTRAHPVLLYRSETYTIKARDARRITSAEMKYMRRTAGYTWTDYKTNTQITKELKITPILNKLLEYKRNWIQHVNRMPCNRLPRVMKHYSATG